MNTDRKVLRLTLKKKWFDMIASGEKKEEYREIKQYWATRLLHGFSKSSISFNFSELSKKYETMNGETLLDAIKKDFTHIEFKNGYGKNSPIMLVEFKGLRIGEAKPEWSDNWKGNVFIILLGEVLLSHNLNIK
jgi:hypothetical protein